LSLKNKLPFHYCWVILVSCCMLVGATVGLVINCKGIFIASVCADFGCSTSAFTLYMTIYGLASAVMLSKVSAAFERFNIRLVLTAALLLFCLSPIMMGSAKDLKLIYAGGVVQGLAGAFLTFVPAPMLIKNWFNSRRGFALGICGMSSGIIGAVMNPVLNEIILKWGWRAGYFSQAAIAFVMAVPFTAFLIIKKPEDIGLAPYGEQQAAKAKTAAASDSTQYMSKGFLLCVLYMAVASVVTCYPQQLSNHAASVGLDSRIGALMLSCAMIGNTGGKAVLGMLSDRFGIKKIGQLAAAITMCSVLMLAFSTKPAVCCFASFLLGACYFSQIIVPPLLVADTVPKSAYDRAYPKVTMAQMTVVAVTPPIIAAIYDFTHSYKPVFLFGAVMEIMLMLVGAIISGIKIRKKETA